MKHFSYLLAIAVTVILLACNGANKEPGSPADSTATGTATVKGVSVKEENVNVAVDTTTMQCSIAYDENKAGGRPIVLIVPEWWGVNNFTKAKARQLAEIGYFAMVVDIFGNGRTAGNPDVAMAMVGPFYKNPQQSTGRLKAALAKAQTYIQADSSKTAAIGFCFGGTMVLNAAKLGIPLDGVVSFHGGLPGIQPTKNTVKSKILVCHGAADNFVPAKDVATFKKQLDSVGVPYTFKDYPGALHAFTNPESNENAKKFNLNIAYNEEADKNSWNDMREFFAGLWP